MFQLKNLRKKTNQIPAKIMEILKVSSNHLKTMVFKNT